MKQYITKIIYLLSLLFGLSLLSCEADLEESNKNSQNNIVIKKYTFEKANTIEKFYNANLKITKNLNKIKAANKGTSKENTYSFIIDSTTVKEISVSNYTSYTMQIRRVEYTENYFENLVIEVDSLNKTNAYLVKYTPSQEMVYNSEHDDYSFNGTVNTSKIIDPGNYDGGINTGPCVMIMKCSYGGRVHLAGTNCTMLFPALECNVIPIGYGGYYNHDPVGGVSNGGSTTTTTSPITAPVYQPTPINTYIIHENCEELKQLGNTNSDKPNIKADIDWLKSKVTQPNNTVEFSVEIKKVLQQNGSFKYEKNQITDQQQYSVGITTSPFHIGGAHSHPEDGYSMFSYGDVKVLAEAYEAAYPSRKPEVVLMLVCRDKITGLVNTYAIKVDDINILRSQVNAVWNSPKYVGLNDEQKIVMIHRDQAIKYETSKSDLEKSFLQQFSSGGFSFYKATDDSMTKWENLQLESNPNLASPDRLIVIKRSCN